MNFNDIPRKYTLGLILVAIIALTAVTAFEPGSLFRDKNNYDDLRKQAEEENKQYEALLAAVQPDYEASQQFLQKIATDDLVRQEVQNALNVKQRIVIPQISTEGLKMALRDDRDTAINYLNDLGSMIQNYNNDTGSKITSLFSDAPDVAAISEAQEKTRILVQNIRGKEVPKSAVELHKAELVAYEKYGQYLDTAKAYATGMQSNPWADVYGQYAVIDNRMDAVKSEMDRLTVKFALDMTPQAGAAGLALVKTAQAGWPVIDIWNVAWQGVKHGLAASFARFALQMIDKLVSHIEKNFAIASQLYYSNELGRYYSVEYMKKFVSDPLDQEIIKQFLPEYFCIPKNKEELKQIFTAKASESRGTDVILDPNDPEFLQKLAGLGKATNYPQWWDQYYESLASKTQQEAQSAATKEVVSPGLKSGRDLINGQITKTMASIFNVQQSAITGAMDLGTNNAENVAAQIVSGIVQNLVNRFVFTPLGGGEGGSISSAGGIGVSIERNVCIRTPQTKPVTAVPESVYQGGASDLPQVQTTTPPFAPR